MKKITKEIQAKSISELEKEVTTLRSELAKLQLEKKLKPQKDTNMFFKKQKRLAVVLTTITQKLGVKEQV